MAIVNDDYIYVFIYIYIYVSMYVCMHIYNAHVQEQRIPNK